MFLFSCKSSEWETNAGKSPLLNEILQVNHVLVGPDAGSTRDSIRVDFQCVGRNVYLVDSAGWLERTKQEKGPSCLSIMQSRKHLMRAHVVSLVLDAEGLPHPRSFALLVLIEDDLPSGLCFK
ncbi:hypothetical protein Pfo_005057 [Paulownia fortunei]|nr:hypothetical protein Pfo_005057 [Paulownia fortunei]